MRVKVLGKYWDLSFPPNLGSNDGLCQGPANKAKKMYVQGGLRGEEFLDTIIHEMIHAAGWHLDEPFVTQFAADLAKVLTHPEIRRRIDGE
jgi:hypothetical protein